MDGGNWSFESNTVEAGQFGTSANPTNVEANNLNVQGSTTGISGFADGDNFDGLGQSDFSNLNSLQTNDLTVTGTVTGISGGIKLDNNPSDTFTRKSVAESTANFSEVLLFDGVAKTVLSGTVYGRNPGFRYVFADGQNFTNRNFFSGTQANAVTPEATDTNDDEFGVLNLPPAENITKIAITDNQFQTSALSADVILRD